MNKLKFAKLMLLASLLLTAKVNANSACSQQWINNTLSKMTSLISSTPKFTKIDNDGVWFCQNANSPYNKNLSSSDLLPSDLSLAANSVSVANNSPPLNSINLISNRATPHNQLLTTGLDWQIAVANAEYGMFNFFIGRTWWGQCDDAIFSKLSDYLKANAATIFTIEGDNGSFNQTINYAKFDTVPLMLEANNGASSQNSSAVTATVVLQETSRQTYSNSSGARKLCMIGITPTVKLNIDSDSIAESGKYSFSLAVHKPTGN